MFEGRRDVRNQRSEKKECSVRVRVSQSQSQCQCSVSQSYLTLGAASGDRQSEIPPCLPSMPAPHLTAPSLTLTILLGSIIRLMPARHHLTLEKNLYLTTKSIHPQPLTNFGNRFPSPFLVVLSTLFIEENFIVFRLLSLSIVFELFPFKLPSAPQHML